MRIAKWVLRPFVTVPVALLLLAACAAGAGRSRVQSPEVLIQVVNDLNPPRTVTIRLTSQTGQRALLGSLAAGQSRTFRHQDAAYHGQYQLTAEGGAFGEIRSTAFALSPGTRVVWAMQSNSVRVPEE